ncbi:hypothetical protein OG481_01900 [Streptomyces longwoodensis]|uniref:hypothetical protein n=1 Tax=Streptomyces longwoodensis TaxID=68231 RepID=UPI002DDB76A4|nr:hypothetical protein [Streptomyces longwoodensis]WRY87345.1 hypothetical protein OG481_01900 [Streptomyces longwoodensis]
MSTVTEPMTRRAYLLAAIQADGQPVTTCRAEQLLDGSPLTPTGRNTVRKALRGLARDGLLIAQDLGGRRIYLIPTTTGEDGLA